jgi:signal transduction histidine kinase
MHHIVSDGFLPHGHCYFWNPTLLTLHVASDFIIGFSYATISLTLYFLTKKRTDLPFNVMFLLFASFIVACGGTHWMEIWTVWHGSYWESGVVKAFTAAVSLATALLFVRLFPKALKLPSIQEFRNTALKSQEANRLKSEFVANMSHELRTPLNSIIGFTELLRSHAPKDPAESQKYLDNISASSKHLLYLINDVLDLSKIDAGKMEFRPEVLDLTKLVAEVSESIRSTAVLKNIEVVVDIASHLGVIVADPIRVKQILLNYLSNAVKFTPEGGKIKIRIYRQDTLHFRLDVEDTGIGIAKEHFQALFSRFWQVESGMTRKYPGTGLGLALTKSIVEAQGGHVEVESTLHKGSTFSAILPCLPAPAKKLE